MERAADITLANCNCCPRQCGVDRVAGEPGWCNTVDGASISSICAHYGEEPVLSGKYGICNVFFSHCNLQCVYCQNYQISDNTSEVEAAPFEWIINSIESILGRGTAGVGFVSPSHFVPQMLAIIDALRARGHTPTYVYNSNGYDRTGVVASLEGTIDVYLPDMKYMDDRLAEEYSQVDDYSIVARAALKEMYRQKGSEIHLDDHGLVTSGLIIRHLVLPGHVDNSKGVLRFIAEELSPNVHISLMSQYYPTARVRRHPILGRTVTADEYNEVLEEFERLGFHRGWVQELSSPHNYLPDFVKNHPFESEDSEQ